MLKTNAIIIIEVKEYIFIYFGEFYGKIQMAIRTPINIKVTGKAIEIIVDIDLNVTTAFL